VHGEVLAAGELLHREGLDLARSAVVLPDPAALMPLLWEVMGSVDSDYNLTMGYPLTRTPVFALLDQVLRASEGDSRGRVRTAGYLALLLHPYVKNLEAGDGATLRVFAHAVEEMLTERGEPFLDVSAFQEDRDLLDRAARVAGGSDGGGRLVGALAQVHEVFLWAPRRSSTLGELAGSLLEVLRQVSARSPARFHPFYEEFFERAAGCLASLAQMRVSREPFSDRALLHQLVRGAFEEARVPFNGLPVEGLQVMGVLETQTLSFDTVLLLDANEEVLPALSRADPALPPPFRAALGLPGYAERMEVAKYHVFRLAEAAREVHVIYRETPDAQRSPFVEQLVYEAERAAGRCNVLVPRPLAFRGCASSEEAPRVAKDEALLSRLASMPYSASALDAYLNCPMKFYLGFAVGLREPERVEEELDVLAVGRRLHAVLADLFRPLADTPLTAALYDELLARLPSALLREFPGTGEQALVRRLAQRRLSERLEGEGKALAPDSALVGVEVRLAARWRCSGADLGFKGFADRIERRHGQWVITDFKSGHDLKKSLPRPEHGLPAEGRRAIFETVRSFQLPLYVELFHRQEGKDYGAIQACLVSLRSPSEEPAALFGGDADRGGLMRSVFLPALDAVAAEILDPRVPFSADPVQPSLCRRCSYASICRKTGKA
jgi:hypothetical protein